MRGRYLLQIRTAESPGFLLNPAAVPVHDPSLITTHPQMEDAPENIMTRMILRAMLMPA